MNNCYWNGTVNIGCHTFLPNHPAIIFTFVPCRLIEAAVASQVLPGLAARVWWLKGGPNITKKLGTFSKTWVIIANHNFMILYVTICILQNNFPRNLAESTLKSLRNICWLCGPIRFAIQVASLNCPTQQSDWCPWKPRHTPRFQLRGWENRVPW